MTRCVAIVQRRLTHYRVPLFERLRARLAQAGVRLRLLHGHGTRAEASKNDQGHLDWAEPLPTRYAAGGRLCWQPYWAQVRDCDLVVVTQENKLLNNLRPLLDPWRQTPLAFWGHGGNLQSAKPGGAAERFKRWTTRRADWWFAYTELSAARVAATGYPRPRITVLNNSIDTAALRAQLQQARSLSRDALRQALGLGPGPVGVFIGSLYADKRIAWLLQAAAELRRQVAGFELVIAGAGPDEPLVRAAAAQHPWLHYLGAVHGPRKAELLAAADLMLNPGLVGLGILDAFVAGLPFVTAADPRHGPEIAYLQHGSNGIMTTNHPGAYVSACRDLLGNASALQAMAQAALAAGQQYSIESMAERFAQGLLDCLAATAPRR